MGEFSLSNLNQTQISQPPSPVPRYPVAYKERGSVIQQRKISKQIIPLAFLTRSRKYTTVWHSETQRELEVHYTTGKEGEKFCLVGESSMSKNEQSPLLLELVLSHNTLISNKFLSSGSLICKLIIVVVTCSAFIEFSSVSREILI